MSCLRSRSLPALCLAISSLSAVELLCSVTVAVGVGVPFATATTAAGGARTRSIQPVDLDADGDLDLLYVFSTGASGNVAWLRNNGSGSFSPSANIHSGFNNARVAVAGDVDGDGDLDVFATSLGLNDVYWFENTAGDASAWAPHSIDVGFGNARGLTAGDFDLDGDLDVAATGSLASGHLAWWENLGAGVFSTKQDIENGTLDTPRRVQSGDLDGDGDLDLVVAVTGENRIAWWRNDLRTMAGWNEVEVTTFFDGARDARPFDMDGDGDLDILAVAGDEDLVAWFENTDGAGTAWTPRLLPGFFSTATEAVAEDFDADGDLDVVGIAASGNIDVSWWQNLDGVGTSWQRTTIDGAFATGAAIIAADVDGDGDSDVVGGSSAAGTPIRIWKNETLHRSALFPAEQAIVADSFAGVHHVAAADIDRDGLLDAIAADEMGGEVGWFRNPGPTDDPWPYQQVDAAMAGARHVTAADLDADGDPDLVGAADGDNTVVWWQNVAGDGSTWVEQAIDPTFAGARFVAVADFDADGALDVAGAGYGGNRIVWWRNVLGDGSVWGQTNVDTNFKTPRCVRAADLDRDGRVDLIAASWTTGDLAWWSNDGVGSFSSEGVIGSATSSGFRRFEVVDLDRDGDLDVLAAATNDHHVLWFENTAGDASAWTPRDIDAAFAGPRDVRGVDVDLDGDLDVVSGSGDLLQVVWWENSAGDESVWDLHVADDTVSFPSGLDVADLDRDGDADLLAGSALALAGTIRWWQNRGGQFALPTEDAVTEAQPLENSEAAVLRIEATHRGRAGDADVELLTFDLAFADGEGQPMDDATFDSLVDFVRLYGDGSMPESFDGSDSELFAFLTPTLDEDGATELEFPLPAVTLQVEQGTPRVYWLVLDLAAGSATLPVDSIQVTHRPASTSTAQMLDSGLATDPPLLLEYAADVTSSILTINAAPVEDSAIPNQQAVQDQPFSLDAAPFVSDPDGDELTFTLVDGFGFLAISPEGLLTGTPDAVDAAGGPYGVEIEVSDGATGMVSLDFDLAVDQAPFVAAPITEQRVDPGVDPALDLSGGFDDPEGDPLSFSASGLPASLSMSTAGVVSGTPLEAEIGAYVVTVTAMDPYGAEVSTMFDLVVNGPPTAVSPLPGVGATEGATVAEDLSAHFSDPNGDAMTFAAVGLPDSLQLTAAGVVTGVPSTLDTDLGTPFLVEVTADDGFGGQVTVEVTVTLTADPDALAVDGFESGDFAGWSTVDGGV